MILLHNKSGDRYYIPKKGVKSIHYSKTWNCTYVYANYRGKCERLTVLESPTKILRMLGKETNYQC